MTLAHSSNAIGAMVNDIALEATCTDWICWVFCRPMKCIRVWGVIFRRRTPFLPTLPHCWTNQLGILYSGRGVGAFNCSRGPRRLFHGCIVRWQTLEQRPCRNWCFWHWNWIAGLGVRTPPCTPTWPYATAEVQEHTPRAQASSKGRMLGA
jgi:hypothetical protein